MAFEHHADQRSVALQALFQHFIEYRRLTQRVFAAVGVAAIDHDPRGYLGLGQVLFHLGHALRIVVRPTVTAAQHQVRVEVARGLDDRRVALAVDAEVPVRVGRRAHRIAGNGDTAVGAVLESDGHAQAAGHFAVDLRLGGARTDGDPTEQVFKVAGGHGL